MLAAAFAGSGAISGALTMSGCARWRKGVRLSAPASFMAVTKSEKAGYARSKLPSMLPSKTKSLAL